jgi:hypothetical protein
MSKKSENPPQVTGFSNPNPFPFPHVPGPSGRVRVCADASYGLWAMGYEL